MGNKLYSMLDGYEVEHTGNPILDCCSEMDFILSTGMPVEWKQTALVAQVQDFLASQGYHDIVKRLNLLNDQFVMEAL